MDPTTCYREMMEAYEAGRTDEAQESAESLVTWMQRGGFPPAGMSRHEAHRAAYRVIRAALAAH